MKHIEYYGYTDQGIRTENQDNFTVFKNKYDFLIAAVADGMGGHEGGKYASTVTIKLIEYIFKNIDFGKKSDQEIQDFLLEAISKIQNYLIQETEEKDLPRDMGTTLNLDLFVKNKIFTLNIGDSRTIHYTKKNIVQISEDHNLSTLAKKDPNFAKFEKYSNYLTSALGPKKDSKVDIFITPLEKIGMIIITSDGVHNHISKEEIIKILKNKEVLKNKVEAIVNKALFNKSTDNATSVVVKYES